MTAAESPEQAIVLVDWPGDSEDLLAVIEQQIKTCARFGFRRILLLVSGSAEPYDEVLAAAQAQLPDASIDVSLGEGGTAGLLHSAGDHLADRFLLLDGGCVFDANWLDLVYAESTPETLVVSALQHASAAPARAGVHLVDRRILDTLPQRGSFSDVLPLLSARGLVAGRVLEGAFFDLAEPGAYAAAAAHLARPRPAIFFDRDGTINVDVGYPHRPDQLEFLPGAIAAVKRVNDLGYYAFLVTNQSGVARGFFGEAEVHAFHAHLQRKLRAAGAHLDDIRFCPDLPGGKPPYDRASDWRKPAPGMFLDLMAAWPVIRGQSLGIGDKDSDVAAAEAAGLRGLLYTGGSLDDVLAPHLGGPNR